MTMRAASPGISSAEAGQPGGVATLDGSGHIPTSQMPVGDVTYKGNWNATTNTPTLANGVGTAGDLHICDVAGSQNLGAGVVVYGVGDWLIYDGAVWDRVPGAGAAPANPSVTVGLTAKNGTAGTFMRSDAAPALAQNITPTWTGAHAFTQTMTTAAITASGLISSSGGVAGNTSVTAGIGSNSVQMDGAPNGQDPVIRALGATDANVSISFQSKGTGVLKFPSVALFSAPLSFTGNSPWTTGGSTGTDEQVLTSTGNATQPIWRSAAIIVGGSSRTAQAANVNVTNFYTVPVGGQYRISAYVVVSQAATTSSTMPSASISYTEAVTGAAVQDLITSTATGNTVGLHSGGSVVIQAQQGSNLSFITSSYASSGATPMQYAVHLTVERIN